MAGPFSPDGKWLVTETADSGGAPAIYIERFPELTDRRRVSAEGGSRNAVWSPDGREIYYRRTSDRAMMAVSIQTAPQLVLGTPRVLFESRGYNVISESRSWDVAPDGRFLMLKDASSPESAESREILLVQNWFTEIASTFAAK